jgi:hypothetical protein
VVNPIVILLIYTIRVGQLPYNTSTEILEQYKKSQTKSLAWTSPLLLVILAIRTARTGLDLARPDLTNLPRRYVLTPLV